MGTAPFQAPEPGTLVAGKYRVERVLASGGMGVVVVAEHVSLGQKVAIKFLLPEAAEKEELAERFLREARAAARLESDHVVRVFDIGKEEGSVPFMVMELLTGVDLGQEMAARGPLPVAEAVTYIVQALDAIVEAHAGGIVHRDLKPSNLFLAARTDGTRRIKVLDFGISKMATDALAAPNAALTSTRSMLGSPGYMSPEQVRSTRSVDVRTDVWALGVILYELLTGAPAFDGETLGDIFAKIREEDLPPIRSVRPDVPEGLAAVIEESLQRDRNKRTADAATLRRNLLPFTEKGSPLPVAPLSSSTPPPPDSREAIERAPTQAAVKPSAPSTVVALTTKEPEAPRLGAATLAAVARDNGARRSQLVIGTVLGAAVAGLLIWGYVRSPPKHGDAAVTATATASFNGVGQAPPPTPKDPGSTSAAPPETSAASPARDEGAPPPAAPLEPSSAMPVTPASASSARRWAPPPRPTPRPTSSPVSSASTPPVARTSAPSAVPATAPAPPATSAPTARPAASASAPPRR